MSWQNTLVYSEKSVCISITITLTLHAKQRAHLSDTMQRLSGGCSNDAPTDVRSLALDDCAAVTHAGNQGKKKDTTTFNCLCQCGRLCWFSEGHILSVSFRNTVSVLENRRYLKFGCDSPLLFTLLLRMSHVDLGVLFILYTFI